jgi:predicted AlkP superfamily phosphohydrolase/phosphomutase
MVTFADNFPPQLIYSDPEDKFTFLEEMDISFNWHKNAVNFILDKYKPDFFLVDNYNPNQMLSSRWWMGYLDPTSSRYSRINETEREKLWTEVREMYRNIDDILGTLLDHADENTYVILTSDHGICPLNKYIRLNNFFAEKGWLKFSIDSESGEPVVDWEKTQVIYLQMDNIYIQPNGLAGNWSRGSGDEYEKLRTEVMSQLKELKDTETGVKPLALVARWEDAPAYGLPADRVGDLIIGNHGGYGFSEQITSHGSIFTEPQESGYKQAIMPQSHKGLLVPIIIMGPGVKKNYRIENTVSIIDTYPTLIQFLGIDAEQKNKGRILEEIINK